MATSSILSAYVAPGTTRLKTLEKSIVVYTKDERSQWLLMVSLVRKLHCTFLRQVFIWTQIKQIIILARSFASINFYWFVVKSC